MAHADVAFGYCLLFFSLSSLGTSVKVRQLSRETSDYSDFTEFDLRYSTGFVEQLINCLRNSCWNVNEPLSN